MKGLSQFIVVFGVLLAFVWLVFFIYYGWPPEPIDIGPVKLKPSVDSCPTIANYSILPLHPELFKGRSIIYYTDPLVTGGPASLHYLHCTLVQLGFNNYMHNPNPAFNLPESCIRPMEEILTEDNDVLISPENIKWSERVLKIARGHDPGNPLRVILYMMGLKPADMILPEPNPFILASVNLLIRDSYFAPSKYILRSPMDNMVTQAYYKDQSRGVVYNKSDIIVFDNDFGDALELKSEIRRLASANMRRIQLFDFKGREKSQAIDLLRSAKVIVDLHMPGSERINLEGIMFDAIPLMTGRQNGADFKEFKVPTKYKLNELNVTEMAEQIYHTVRNYQTVLPEFSKMKARVLGLAEMFPIHLSGYFSSQRVMFYTVPHTLEEEAFSIPWATHISVNYPLSKIDIGIFDLPKYNTDHTVLFHLVPKIFSLNSGKLNIHQFEGNYGQFGGDSALRNYPISHEDFVVIMDSRNLVVDNQLVNCLLYLLNDEPLNPTYDRGYFVAPNSLFASARGNIVIAKRASFGFLIEDSVSLYSVHEFTPQWLEEYAKLQNGAIHSLLPYQVIDISPYSNTSPVPDQDLPICLVSNFHDTQHGKPVQMVNLLSSHLYLRSLEQFKEKYPKFLYHKISQYNRPETR